MANHRAYMKFYVADYLADTEHLKPAEHGAYLLLIMSYWQHGSLPNDNQRLARICRMDVRTFAKMRVTLSAFFQQGWRHKRIDQERQLADELHEKRSRAAVISNARRAHLRAHVRPLGDPYPYKNITTTETVPRARGSGRPRKEELEPTPELLETIDRKDRKH